MQENAIINRKHKDRLFRFIFHDKEALLSLYNAINDSDYQNAEELQIFTMENFVYMGMKNDLSFLIDMNLNVFEHQSTYNSNMPLRGYMYMSSALQKYIAINNLDIYSSREIIIPIPRYYVFYNGRQDRPDEETLKLTDCMSGEDAEEKSSAQFIAHMININAGKSPKIMQRCPLLYEYSLFIDRIRKGQDEGVDYAVSVEQAVDYCIENNVLYEILRAHKAEVTSMLLEEYDEQLHIANEKAISQEEGLEKGIEQGRNLERANTLKEKMRADSEKVRADSERDRADLERLHKEIFKAALKGKTAEEIAEDLKASIEEVEKVLSEI